MAIWDSKNDLLIAGISIFERRRKIRLELGGSGGMAGPIFNPLVYIYFPLHTGPERNNKKKKRHQLCLFFVSVKTGGAWSTWRGCLPTFVFFLLSFDDQESDSEY